MGEKSDHGRGKRSGREERHGRKRTHRTRTTWEQELKRREGKDGKGHPLTSPTKNISATF